MRSLRIAAIVFASAVVAPPAGLCQSTTADPPPLTAGTYAPISTAQRVDWIVDGTIGRRSLTLVGPLATVWQTGFNTPEEWGRGFSGIAKRYAQREAAVAISNTIEAG